MGESPKARLRVLGTVLVVACAAGVAALALWPGSTPERSPAAGTEASHPVDPSQALEGAAGADPEGSPEEAVGPSPEGKGPHKVVASYFHRTVRCDSCLMIEDVARRTIETDFFPALVEGTLEWVPVNIDEPENAHFEDDFDLAAQSLVLAKVRGGNTAEGKNLSDVWKLLHSPPELERYVRDEVAEFLK